MRIIERREPRRPIWQGPWQCVTCKSILEADNESEIRVISGEYQATDYVTYCPVCETERALSRPPFCGLEPASTAVCTKRHNTGIVTESIPNGIAVKSEICPNCGRRSIAMNHSGAQS